MRFTKCKLSMLHLFGLALLTVLTMSPSAFAQGSVFGTVTNANASTPANGQITFVGFLDNTDEEIRLESADGAGYDAGNWFDDFQNYLTEAAGNPYYYYFFNTANGEGFHLADVIPNNSFQQENVALAAVAWPSAPTGLAGVTASGSTVILSWESVGGLTYHVYRRVATSNGSFFRVDDPTGSLANHGVATGYFVDNTVSGGLAYQYAIIAEDAATNLSPHSAILTVNTSGINPPVIANVLPNNGSANGGTLVQISGSGFDPAGVSVLFGATTVTATVVSPFLVTATAPIGTVGAAIDVSVTNTVAGVTSNTLTGGFTYAPNATPELAPIGPQAVTEGALLQFAVTASDIDANTPVLTTSALPGTATFVDNANGTGTFTWTPGFTNAGSYNVTFYATDALDGTLVDSEIVVITVNEAGNQRPVVAAIADTTIAESATLTLTMTATDADGEIPGLSVAGLPATNAAFVDNLDGTGTLTFTPDFAQAGSYPLTFIAVDAALAADSELAVVTVTNVNQLPVLAAIGQQAGTEQIPLIFAINATDPDDATPILTTSALPGTAVFTDSLNGVGAFDWTPGFADAGTYSVTFYATDAESGTAVDSEVVEIVIGEAGNQAPVLAAIPTPVVVSEGQNIGFTVSATDPDETIPSFTAEDLPTGATLIDNLNGSGSFDWTPTFEQAGDYDIRFIASDGSLTDSQLVRITVGDGGNLAPVIAPIADASVAEGAILVVNVSATDPDGGGVFPTLSVSTAMQHYTFVDNHDGTGTLTYTPNYFDAGLDSVFFFALDAGVPPRTASVGILITTSDVNQPPVIDSLGPFAVAVEDSLIFTVTATDPTDPVTAHRIVLSSVGLPQNASFVDNGNNTGTFAFLPSVAQVGPLSVTFLAVDQGTPQLSSTRAVVINVVAENNAPAFAEIAPQVISEGVELVINVSATDPDGAIPVLSTVSSPEGSVFVDNGNGTGVFTWTPSYLGSTRLASVTFRATDGIAVTRVNVLIQVNDAGNQAPVFASLPEPIPPVDEGATIEVRVAAADPDGGSIILAAVEATLPPHATFVDSGNGAGLIIFSPDFSQSGIFDIEISAYDGPVDNPATLMTTLVVSITVNEMGNQPPVMADLTAERTVQENANLQFTVTATDPDGTSPTMTAVDVPANATFTDNADGTGSFSFTPNFTQAGVYVVTFTASDGEFSDSRTVTITVNDVNRLPFIFPPDGETIYEYDVLTLIVETFDADGTIPYVTAHLNNATTLAANMTLVDNRDGTATFTFIPDYTQGGTVANPTPYQVIFVATDEDYPAVLTTSEVVTIRVINRNQAPTLDFPSGMEYTADEGGVVSFEVYLTDVDNTTPLTLSAQNLPDSNASLYVLGGYALFTFNPDYTQAGDYAVTFIGVDAGGLADTGVVGITIVEAGNQPPGFANMPDTLLVPVGKTCGITVKPIDPELDSMSIEAFPILPGASWTDDGKGTGVYTLNADSTYLNQVIVITFVATDYPSLAQDTLVAPIVIVNYLRGDLDNDTRYTINDVASLIGYLFRNGPAPTILEAADVDGDGYVNVGDVTFLVYYMWYYGPQPPR